VGGCANDSPRAAGRACGAHRPHQQRVPGAGRGRRRLRLLRHLCVRPLPLLPARGRGAIRAPWPGAADRRAVPPLPVGPAGVCEGETCAGCCCAHAGQSPRFGSSEHSWAAAAPAAPCLQLPSIQSLNLARAAPPPGPHVPSRARVRARPAHHAGDRRPLHPHLHLDARHRHPGRSGVRARGSPQLLLRPLSPRIPRSREPARADARVLRALRLCGAFRRRRAAPRAWRACWTRARKRGQAPSFRA